jgi:lysozyme family protein
MQADYLPVEKRIIDSEGTRYTDGVHPYDPGGPTRYGITLKDARLHWKRDATANDVRLMPLSVALAIYKSKYWDAMNCDALPAGLDYTVMDYGVNSGTGRSGKVLRRLCALPDNTSRIDATVIDAVSKRDTLALIHAMNKERLAFLETLKIWSTYGRGWATRVRGVDSFSAQLAANPQIAADAPTLKPTPPVLPGATEGPVPLPPERPIEETGATKGMVPPPKVAKGTVTTAAGGAGGASAAHWWDWIAAHPGPSIVIAVCAAILVFVIVKAINDRHTAAQEAPAPGTVPVPIKA